MSTQRRIPIRVLILERGDELLELICEELTPLPCEVVACASVEEAMEVFVQDRTLSFDLVVTSKRLWRQSAHEEATVGALRRLLSDPERGLVLFTGDLGINDADAKLEGWDVLFTKPGELPDLIDYVRRRAGGGS